MATIRDHVRATLGETYQKLTEIAGYDDSDKPDAVGLKIGSTMSRIFEEGTVEDDLSEFSRLYVSIMVSRLLIPLAIDYYMVNTSHTANLTRPSGVTPLGGEVANNYDRIGALRDMEKQLSQQQAEMLADFLAVNRDLLLALKVQPGARVSTGKNQFLTDDPRRTFFRPRQPLLFGGDFGVFWGVVPEQPYIINPDPACP